LEPESPGFTARPVTQTELHDKVDACVADFLSHSVSTLDHSRVRVLEEKVKVDKSIHRVRQKLAIIIFFFFFLALL
jgi:hypothetical protein